MSALDDARGELIAEARMWPRDGVNEGRLINALADEIERLTAPSTDDEREALYDGAWRAVSGRDEPWGGCAEREKVLRVAEFAAEFRRQGPITDAQVEAAVTAWEAQGWPKNMDSMLRVALEAARAVS